MYKNIYGTIIEKMGFFDWIGDGVSNLWKGVKNAVGWVADKVSPVVNTIADVAGYIPGIGGIVEQGRKYFNTALGIGKAVAGDPAAIIDVGKKFIRSPPS